MSARSSSNPEHAAGGNSTDWLVLLGLTGLWIALVLLVDPRGEFPLIDDWSYGRSVKTLVEQHRLEYDGWNNPTLFVQVLYGALFCLPFGFSFEALRISALVAGLAGGIGTYALLRQVTASAFIAGFASLVAMLNPIYFEHSFTFMTDVPFAALAVASGVFFLRALRTGSGRDAAVGTAVACAATLVRQIGIAVPLGYALALIIMQGWRRPTLLRAGLPVIVTCAALGVYNGVIDYLHMTPALSGAAQNLILSRLATYGPLGLLSEALKAGIWISTYGACFILPFLLLPIGRKAVWKELSGRTKIVIALICAGFFLLVLSRNLPPGNPLLVFRIPPMGLLNEGGWGAIEEPAVFRQTLSVIAMAAAAWMAAIIMALGFRFVKRGWAGSRSDAAAVLFGVATPMFMLAPMVLSGFMERYLIAAMPFALLALAVAWKSEGAAAPARRPAAGAAGAIAVLAVYGVLAVIYAHDFLVWNRARWDAANYLIREKGIAPARIDGGFAFNGWYPFTRDERLRTRFINWQKTKGSAPFWRNDAAEYLICFARCDEVSPGASAVVWTQRYAGWLPGADSSIVISRQPASGYAQGLPPGHTDR